VDQGEILLRKYIHSFFVQLKLDKKYNHPVWLNKGIINKGIPKESVDGSNTQGEESRARIGPSSDGDAAARLALQFFVTGGLCQRNINFIFLKPFCVEFLTLCNLKHPG
jgi:hypothetical protein